MTFPRSPLLLLCACFALHAAPEVPAAEPVTTSAIRKRGLTSPGDATRLATVMAKARRGEEIVFGFEGGLLFPGYKIAAAAEPLAAHRIDGGTARPLTRKPNRHPLAEGLPPGPHLVRIETAPVKSPPPGNAGVRIWSLGSAGQTRGLPGPLGAD